MGANNISWKQLLPNFLMQKKKKKKKKNQKLYINSKLNS